MLSVALFANWIQRQHLFSVSCYILGRLRSWCLCHTRNLSVVSDAFLSASSVHLRVTVGPQRLSVTCGCSDPCPKDIYANDVPTHCYPLPLLLFGHCMVCHYTKLWALWDMNRLQVTHWIPIYDFQDVFAAGCRSSCGVWCMLFPQVHFQPATAAVRRLWQSATWVLLRSCGFSLNSD